jgi:hypothetical protein
MAYYSCDCLGSCRALHSSSSSSSSAAAAAAGVTARRFTGQHPALHHAEQQQPQQQQQQQQQSLLEMATATMHLRIMAVLLELCVLTPHIPLLCVALQCIDAENACVTYCLVPESHDVDAAVARTAAAVAAGIGPQVLQLLLPAFLVALEQKSGEAGLGSPAAAAAAAAAVRNGLNDNAGEVMARESKVTAGFMGLLISDVLEGGLAGNVCFLKLQTEVAASTGLSDAVCCYQACMVKVIAMCII